MSSYKDYTVISSASALFQQLYAYVELGKLHLSLYIGVSGIFGYLSATGLFQAGSLVTGFFITLLASGAAVLNNIQDREYDRFFVRTFNRSLPGRKLPLAHAVSIAACLIFAGLSGLWAAAGKLPFFLGLSALFCYNGLYTPLKKRTFFAMVPGSLCGVLVPAIGWTATGRSLLDPVIINIMAIFGTWQMAHFFIILIKTRHKMRKLPGVRRFANFYRLFSAREIKYQTMIWASLYALAMLLFIIKGNRMPPGFYLAVGFNAMATWWVLLWVVFKKQTAITLAFSGINLSVLLFMLTGIANTLIH